MNDSFSDLLEANEAFAATYLSADVEGRAAKGLAVVTCMDSRIDPLSMLGLAKGDAKILRNAGARVTDDVLRTLVLAAHLLGVQRVMVVAHTDCRMSKSTEAMMHTAIKELSGLDTRSLDFGAVADQEAVLSADVQRIRSSPYLPVGMPVMGCVYDLKTGALSVAVPQG